MARVREAMLALAVLVGVLQAGVAAAQSGTNKALAEQLFVAGRELMKAGRPAEACPKLEASLELDPAVGTQLNLARCYEQIGKLASAWGHYREAAGRAKQAGQVGREKAARKFAAGLEPRLPRLVIRVPGAAEMPGLQVAHDGVSVDPVLFDTPIYVDPGNVEVTATASGREPYSVMVRMVVRKETVVEIPVLPLLPRPKRPVARPAPAPVSPQAEVARAPAPPPSGGGLRRGLGLGMGGGGLALVAGGLVFGLAAQSAWNDAFDAGQCMRETLTCAPDGQEKTDAARSRAFVADILIGTGVALAATGAVLYLTAPDPDEHERAARIAPVLGPEALGVQVSGSF